MDELFHLPPAQAEKTPAEIVGHHPHLEVDTHFPEGGYVTQALELMLSHPDAFPRQKPSSSMPEITTTTESGQWGAELGWQLIPAPQYRAAGVSDELQKQLAEILTKVDQEKIPLALDFGTYACGNWQLDKGLSFADYCSLRSILGILSILKEYQKKGFESSVESTLLIADITDPIAKQKNTETNLQFITEIRQLSEILLTQFNLPSDQLSFKIISESELLAQAHVTSEEFAERVSSAQTAIAVFWQESETVYELHLDKKRKQQNNPTLTWKQANASIWNEEHRDSSATIDQNFNFYANEYLAWFFQKYLAEMPSWKILPGKNICGPLSPEFKRELLEKVAVSQHLFLHKPSYETLSANTSLVTEAQAWLARKIVMAEIKQQVITSQSKNVSTIEYQFAKPIADEPKNNAIILKSLGGLTQLDLPPWEHEVEVCLKQNTGRELSINEQKPATKTNKFTTLSERTNLSLQWKKPGKSGEATTAKLAITEAPDIQTSLRYYDQTSLTQTIHTTLAPKS